MNKVLTECPFCSSSLKITKVHCDKCKIYFEGEFPGSRLARLSLPQQRFIEKLVLCNGNLKQLEKELKMSYPAIRSRFDKAITELSEIIAEEDKYKKDIMDKLESGKITAEEAAERFERL